MKKIISTPLFYTFYNYTLNLIKLFGLYFKTNDICIYKFINEVNLHYFFIAVFPL